MNLETIAHGQYDEKQTVLIVDDVLSNIKVLEEILKDECNVISATSGAQALEEAEKTQPDLILLDIIMPEMNGHEVCQKLKQSRLTQDIPVIFITALDGVNDEEKGLQLGAIDYITKPFHAAVVKIRIRNHLELVRSRNRLKQLSTTDGLTGIANRRRFDDLVLKEWARAQRELEPISVMLIDIDYFKKYNDFYGHLLGDECLRTVAHALKTASKRQTDIMARFGGEEFAAVLPKTDIDGTIIFAQKIMNTIAEIAIPHENNPYFDYITVSIGATSVVPDDLITSTEVIDFADNCLYEAKESGRNRFVITPFSAS